ncbi:hypothetical protein J2Z60_001713 [Lactobacillus colini]|uniref:DUF2508 family protein n=1 Tax=Lactobacillus colini TaxID=1819254 RepID=A0ABS4MFZ9_9LACO|nr:YaaL family protein [Lactobacillus colini]MBP2058528.1 hypothetical protein [Lactobacillus colini]
MIRKKHHIKQEGDDKLLRVIYALQHQLAVQKTFSSTTLDLSDENRIADRILRAKYSFLYEEARRRHAKSSDPYSVITQ